MFPKKRVTPVGDKSGQSPGDLLPEGRSVERPTDGVHAEIVGQTGGPTPAVETDGCRQSTGTVVEVSLGPV